MTNYDDNDIHKKISLFHEIIGTCYHEAGHTIICLLNFIKVTSVFIETKSNRYNCIELGVTNYEFALNYDIVQDNILSLKLILSELDINYGGLAAEKIFYKEICGVDKMPMVLKYGSKNDLDNISNIIKKYNLVPSGYKRNSFKKKTLNNVIKTLHFRWEDVKLIAHALFSQKRLNFDDIKKILIKKSASKEFWKQQFKKIDLLFCSQSICEHYSLLMLTK